MPYAILLVILCIVMPLPTLHADTPPWADSITDDEEETTDIYSFYADHQPIQDVLKNFAKSVKTPIKIEETPETPLLGILHGTHQAATPMQFLESLSEEYEFTWYYDGVYLLIYPNALIETRQFPANHETVENLRERIFQSDHWDSRFSMDTNKEENSVVITGPPRMLDMLTNVAASLYTSDDVASRVFRLRHAWAIDKTFSYRDESVTIPGIATILNNLISGGPSLPATTSKPSEAQEKQRAKTGLPGILSGFTSSTNTTISTKTPEKAPVRARIQADPRLNAVIVYDLEANMTRYENLIRSLDIPTGLIEIEAAIIDINTSAISDVGFSWRGVLNNRVAAGFGNITETPSLGTITANVVAQATNPISIATTSADYILSQAKLLQQDDNARILSRPSVITIDNFEASLDLSQTFHVRVEGREAVDLYPVTTGTLLRVTPHIVSSDNTQSIHMAIVIEDGTLLRQEIDNIPVVRNNAINTQALIREGESLIIGGYYFENDTDDESRIPILGDIPFLGRLFGTQRRTKEKNERLYLITPRIVSLPPLPHDTRSAIPKDKDSPSHNTRH